MIKYFKGDLLASGEKRIAHGCNCSGGFGSGFAGQLSVVHPASKESYLLRFTSSGWRLGDVGFVDTKEGREIANCATQERYGRTDEGPYVSYPAIRQVVRTLVRHWPDGFAIPKIGAGLAGGNWDIIAKIIEEESGETEVRVYVL